METPEVLVLAMDSPRIRYMFEHVLGPAMGIRFLLTDNAEKFYHSGNETKKLIYAAQRDIPKLTGSYAESAIKEETNDPEADILRHEVMVSGGEIDLTVEPQWFEGLPSWTLDSESGAPDPVAEIFIHLSRYEEYVIAERDHHQRFISTSAILYRAGAGIIPVADRWIQLLHQWLFTEGLVSSPPADTVPKVQVTLDIDLPWKYRNKKPWYLAYRWCKHLLGGHTGKLVEEMAIWSGRKDDPFDTYDQLVSSTRKLELKPRVFFQIGGNSRYDSGSRYKKESWEHLIRKLSEHWEPGLHPSYESSDADGPAMFKAEKSLLEFITGREITISRQHFLRFRIPETFRHLTGAGITSDYSMGFADAPGWRAGTANPFTWYDLKEEKVTTLTVYPFGLMDVTLKNYMNLKPEEAILKTEELWNELKGTGGSLTFIWHNSSFDPADGWGGWDAVFHHLLQLTQHENTH